MWQQSLYLHVPLGKEAAICCQFIGLRQFHYSLLQWSNLRIHGIDHLKQSNVPLRLRNRRNYTNTVLKKSELFLETKRRKPIKQPKEHHRHNYWSYLQLLPTAFILGESSHYIINAQNEGYTTSYLAIFKKTQPWIKKTRLLKSVLISELPSKELSRTTKPPTRLSCLKSESQKATLKMLWFPIQLYVPPSVQPGLYTSHVLLLHVFWAYSQVLPYLQDLSSSDFPTPKWRHFFCLNYICFTGQRASREKIIKKDRTFFKQLIISQAKLNPRCNCIKSTEEKTPKQNTLSYLCRLNLTMEFYKDIKIP